MCFVEHVDLFDADDHIMFIKIDSLRISKVATYSDNKYAVSHGNA